MSIAEYIANLNRIKDQALANWSNMSATEKQVFEDSFDWLVNNLDIKRGTINVNDDLTNQMNEFVQVVVDLVNKSKGYESKLTGFLGDLDTISKNNEKFHGSFNNFNINTAGVKEVQKTVVAEIINQYTDNGLNPNFAAPLRDGIFRNILAGANMKDIRQYLQVYILGGEDESGKLHSYLNQTAQQAVDSYTGMINQQLNKDFKFTGYIISGSLIETSSTQCIYAVEHANDQGYLSFPEWNQVLDIARNNKKAKLIEGTTIVTLPLNKLHWGCRHDFTPVIIKPKEEPKKATVKKPKAEPQPTAQQAAAQSFFKEAKDKTEARQVVKDMFTNYTGMKVGDVKISNDLDTAQMNRINSKLNQLMNEYNLAKGAVGEHRVVDVDFKSGNGYYGRVSSEGGEIVEMNFGDKTDNDRHIPVADNLAFLRGKSKVDAENADLATVVHEFGHVISVSHQTQVNRFFVPTPDGGREIFTTTPDPKVVEFWKEIVAVKSEYNYELKTLRTFGDGLEESKAANEQKFAEVFLGQYADTNIREFMAEAFTEYKLSANPSKYAKKVGLLIDKFFGK
jgi:hypothetical protein